MNNGKHVARHLVWFSALATTSLVLCAAAFGSGEGSFGPESVQLAADARDVAAPEKNQELRPGASFSWFAGERLFFDAPRFTGMDVTPMLEDAIVDALTAKGFRYVPSPGASDLLVGYTVVLGATLSDTEIKALQELQPELKSLGLDTKSYEKGILIIKVVDAKTRRSIWSNTTHEVANLNMPDDVRKQRVRAAVENVFATLPAVVE